MFNTSFDLTKFVQDIPSLALKKYVWLVLTGTVNATLFKNADRIARQLVADGVELKTMSARDIESMISGPETGANGNGLGEARSLYTLAEEWRAQLESMLNEKERAEGTGSLASTIKLMTGPQRARFDIAGAELLKTIGIDVSEKEIEDTKRESKMRADDIAKERHARIGFTEWIIDNMFASHSQADDPYAELDEYTKEVLGNKVMSAFDKAFTNAKKNVLTGRAGEGVMGVTDMVIIQGLIPKLTAAMYD